MRGTLPPYWPRRFVSNELPVPETQLPENLWVTAKRYPNKVAYWFDGHGLTYQELHRQVELLAGYLEHVCKVRRGDRVLLYMQNSLQYVVGYCAILRASAIVVPVNPMNKTEELTHCAQDCGALGILTADELLESVDPLLTSKKLKWSVVTNYHKDTGQTNSGSVQEHPPAKKQNARHYLWSEAMGANLTASPLTGSPGDPAVIIYTSGTTGQPKGCVLSHHAVMSQIVNAVTWHSLSQAGVILGTVPMYHVTGMQTGINVPIYLGASVAILQRWNAREAIRLINLYSVDEFTAIPTMIIDLLAQKGISADMVPSLRYLRVGGAAMPAAVCKHLQESLGIPYIEGYGLSETVGATLSNPPQHAKPQSGGIPTFNTEAMVIDPETLRELPDGQTGEIIITGKQLFSGYWNRPDADKLAFIEFNGKSFLRTGDLGYRDADGFFYIVDRLKRMINASGFKIWPTEIENILYKHPSVQEACVIATQDEYRGETVKALIVLRSGHKGSIAPDDIVAWAKEQMAAYKYPRIVEFRDALPRSGVGKVLWRELQAQETHGQQNKVT